MALISAEPLDPDTPPPEPAPPPGPRFGAFLVIYGPDGTEALAKDLTPPPDGLWYWTGLAFRRVGEMLEYHAEETPWRGVGPDYPA